MIKTPSAISLVIALPSAVRRAGGRSKLLAGPQTASPAQIGRLGAGLAAATSFRFVCALLAALLSGLFAVQIAAAQDNGARAIGSLPPQNAPASAGPAIAQAPAGQAAPTQQPDDAYILGTGDKLRITVFEEEDLSGEFTVSGTGIVSFPLIGDVPAAGHSLQDLRDQITKRLKDGYITDPRVSAEVLTFRPYYILGEVSRPGEYPYSDGMTVLNAIAKAGGFTYRANRGTVFIKRPDTPDERKTPLNGALTLSPGDTVRVGERFF